MYKMTSKKTEIYGNIVIPKQEGKRSEKTEQ